MVQEWNVSQDTFVLYSAVLVTWQWLPSIVDVPFLHRPSCHVNGPRLKCVSRHKGDTEDEGRWKLHSFSSGSWKFISIKIWNTRFTFVLVFLLSNRDSGRLCLLFLLSSECGVSFYWGPARVNYDSSLFWNFKLLLRNFL